MAEPEKQNGHTAEQPAPADVVPIQIVYNRTTGQTSINWPIATPTVELLGMLEFAKATMLRYTQKVNDLAERQRMLNQNAKG